MLLKEEKKILDEIGEGNSNPFPWDGIFKNSTGKILVNIPVDYKSNEYDLRIVFSFENEDNKSYSIGFSIDGDDEQAFKSPIGFYLRIISTVLRVVEKFIELNNPSLLFFKGLDKRDVLEPGQKDRIYFSYVEKNADRLGFRYGHKKDGLILIKKR